MSGKLWALKMLFLWRWRLGYWDWRTFAAAWMATGGRDG